MTPATDRRGAWLELRSRPTSRRSRRSARSSAGSPAAARPWSRRFDLVDEGLGARVDPTRPAVVRGYVPARDAPRPRRAAAEVAEALGHLQAFGLRTIGELRTRIVHEEDWAEAWKAYFPVLRVGRRLVIRPTWRRHRRQPDDVVLALDPGMAFGTGLHPTTRLCLAALEPLADDGRLAGARVLDVGCGSGILAIAAREARRGRRPSASTPTRSPSRRPLANARRNRLGRRVRPARAASRAASRRSTSSSPTSSPASSCRCAGASTTSCGRAGRSSPRASSSTARPRSAAAFEAAGLRVAGRTAGGRLGRARARPAGLNAGRALRSAAMPADPLPVVLASTSAWPSACSCRRSCCRSRCARGVRRSSRRAGSSGRCCGRSRTGRSSSGGPGADRARPGLASSARRCSQQPWLLVALVIYFVNLAHRLLHPAAEPAPARRHQGRGRRRTSGRLGPERQRYVSYLMAGLVGVIGFLMSTKPSF